jgi:hypothetical protein
MSIGLVADERLRSRLFAVGLPGGRRPRFHGGKWNEKVDLNEPATSNTPVTLSASDGITVPAGTTVLQGQTSATFPITASATAPEWSVITATANGQPLSAVAQVLTGAFVMRATPFSLTLYFRNPTPNKSVVSFTDSNPFRYYGADATRISRRSTPAFEA